MTADSGTLAGEALTFFKALAHESRLKLLGLAAQREQPVGELARGAGVTEPTASHHLAMLREAGLVDVRVDGVTHWYRFRQEGVQELAKRLLSRETVARMAPPEATANESPEDAKVLRGYLLADGRLKSFPASRKKRRVFCAWFARKLSEGKPYSERQINDTIAAHHHDFETFRREMVGYRMLTRARGIYLRTPEREWIFN